MIVGADWLDAHAASVTAMVTVVLVGVTGVCRADLTPGGPRCFGVA